MATKQELADRDELIVKLREAGGYSNRNAWHSALEHLLARTILDGAHDFAHAGEIIINTKQTIERIVIANWGDVHPDKPIGGAS